jgi:hypothetical protein
VSGRSWAILASVTASLVVAAMSVVDGHVVTGALAVAAAALYVLVVVQRERHS